MGPFVATGGFRLAELLAGLSLAIDLGMGQPMEHVLRTCLLSLALGRELGVSGGMLSDVYYVALLRLVGCTADAHETAALAGGDDVGFRSGVAVHTMGGPDEVWGYIMRSSGQTGAREVDSRTVAGARLTSLAAHCEAAEMLAARLGLGQEVCRCLRSGFERWDGKENPASLAGEAIPLPARIAVVARDMEIVVRTAGPEAAIDLAEERRGNAYDPRVADAFLRKGKSLAEEISRTEIWDRTLAAEPEPRRVAPADFLDNALQAFAAFVDMTSPYTLGHSAGVARLAEAGARLLGLPDAEAVTLRKAGLAHDLGRVGIANSVWDKRGALTSGEWERVRLHPYLSERILARCPPLALLAGLAGSHHERLDGSGYHRGSAQAAQSLTCRVLAAADAFQAMTQERPHRPALGMQAARRLLLGEVRAGRLDRRAAEAVLAASGAAPRGRIRAVSGLTAREIEVLRLICRGHTNREVAALLGITPKTAGHHIQHIYDKTGLSSRAGATLFAVRHGLLEE